LSNDQKGLKVTDKRMFTPEGELREEYRFLAQNATPESAPAAVAPEPAPAAEPPVVEREVPGYGSARVEIPGAPPELGPSFYDLVSMLAEPAALYLGDLALPDGETAENLEMARLHIDLLDVLRQKTVGNLVGQEAAYLEDLLYRLRVRYVQKSR
jgi:hypothetical protein